MYPTVTARAAWCGCCFAGKDTHRGPFPRAAVQQAFLDVFVELLSNVDDYLEEVVKSPVVKLLTNNRAFKMLRVVKEVGAAAKPTFSDSESSSDEEEELLSDDDNLSSDSSVCVVEDEGGDDVLNLGYSKPTCVTTAPDTVTTNVVFDEEEYLAAKSHLAPFPELVVLRTQMGQQFMQARVQAMEAPLTGDIDTDASVLYFTEACRARVHPSSFLTTTKYVWLSKVWY